MKNFEISINIFWNNKINILFIFIKNNYILNSIRNKELFYKPLYNLF